MENNYFKLFKEKPGGIYPNGVWVCMSDGYTYTEDTLEKLIDVLNKSWKNDNHSDANFQEFLYKDSL